MKISIKPNPVLTKEIKINSRSTKTLVSLLAIDSLLALVGLVIYWVAVVNYDDYMNYEELMMFYYVMAGAIFVVFLVIIPALTASAISGERERQTLEILLTTKMKSRQIVIGKIGAALCTLGMYTIMSMPILSLIFTIGGINLFDIVKLYAMVIFTGFFVGSIGIYFSTVTKKTISAIVVSYFVELFLAGGTLVIIYGVYFIMEIDVYTPNGNYVGSDVGPLILIALLNPAMTFLDFMDTQVGSRVMVREMFGYLSSFGGSFLYDNWTIISICIQLVLGILILLLSARKLNPVRKPSIKKTKA